MPRKCPPRKRATTDVAVLGHGRPRARARELESFEPDEGGSIDSVSTMRDVTRARVISFEEVWSKKRLKDMYGSVRRRLSTGVSGRVQQGIQRADDHIQSWFSSIDELNDLGRSVDGKVRAGFVNQASAFAVGGTSRCSHASSLPSYAGLGSEGRWGPRCRLGPEAQLVEQHQKRGVVVFVRGRHQEQRGGGQHTSARTASFCATSLPATSSQSTPPS